MQTNGKHENSQRRVRVQVWLSGENSPTVSLDGEIASDSEPQVGDVVALGNYGFEMTHKEFERDGNLFVGYAVIRHDAGLAEEAMKISDSIARELGIPD